MIIYDIWLNKWPCDSVFMCMTKKKTFFTQSFMDLFPFSVCVWLCSVISHICTTAKNYTYWNDVGIPTKNVDIWCRYRKWVRTILRKAFACWYVPKVSQTYVIQSNVPQRIPQKYAPQSTQWQSAIPINVQPPL